jgi:hypothetical protein
MSSDKLSKVDICAFWIVVGAAILYGLWCACGKPDPKALGINL